MAGKTPKLKQYDRDVENGRESLCIFFVSSIVREKAEARMVRYSPEKLGEKMLKLK